MRPPLSSRTNNRPEHVACDDALVFVAWSRVIVCSLPSRLRLRAAASGARREAPASVRSALLVAATWTLWRRERIDFRRETLFRVANEWTTCGRSAFFQKRVVALQPRNRKVHEGADSGH